MNTPLPTVRRPGRDTRRPFGSHNQKLAYESRSGFHRHWFNEDPGRIDQALAAGYTHVEDKEGKKVARVVGTNPAGGPLMGYLMEIPEEWYQEDMVAGQKKVDELDASIRRGDIAGEVGSDGRYVPKDRGIMIRQGR